MRLLSQNLDTKRKLGGIISGTANGGLSNRDQAII